MQPAIRERFGLILAGARIVEGKQEHFVNLSQT
jgi:hypothetical protein